MFDFLFSNNGTRHYYTLGATGDIKVKEGMFTSRQAAEEKMYKIIGKHHLCVRKIYDDKHYKTYLCNNGINFYINRV